MPRKALLVGAGGKQGESYRRHLAGQFEWAGMVEIDAARRTGLEAAGAPVFSTVEAAVAAVEFDVAIVAVPHGSHFATTTVLLAAGRHVIKEKPLALCPDEAERLVALADRHDVALLTVAQRPYRETAAALVDNLSSIGEIRWYEYDYHVNVGAGVAGWRADPAVAGGGVFVDMGYHMLNLLLRLFGDPELVDAAGIGLYSGTGPDHLEDVALARYRHPDGVVGRVCVSRRSPEKYERLVVHGSDGVLVWEPARTVRYPASGPGTELAVSEVKNGPAVKRMFSVFSSALDDRSFRADDTALNLRTVQQVQEFYQRIQ